jgi:hypothetical protein
MAFVRKAKEKKKKRGKKRWYSVCAYEAKKGA